LRKIHTPCVEGPRGDPPTTTHNRPTTHAHTETRTHAHTHTHTHADTHTYSTSLHTRSLVLYCKKPCWALGHTAPSLTMNSIVLVLRCNYSVHAISSSSFSLPCLVAPSADQPSQRNPSQGPLIFACLDRSPACTFLHLRTCEPGRLRFRASRSLPLSRHPSGYLWPSSSYSRYHNGDFRSEPCALPIVSQG
ncbi:hypothetical protein BCV70DRAFT_223386, partial [Testicularia cyperi]